MKNKSLSIIIPAWNEQDTIKNTLNKYIERYWWNLHAKSGKDLLILAVAKAPTNWKDKLNHLPANKRLRRLVRKNLRFLDRPDGISKARSTIHAFLRQLETHNKKRFKLPALALFEWSYEQAKAAEETISDTYRIWEKYSALMDLSILELPVRVKPAEIDKIFDDLLSALHSAKDFQALKKRIRRMGLILRLKTTAGSLFCLFERLAPFVK